MQIPFLNSGWLVKLEMFECCPYMNTSASRASPDFTCLFEAQMLKVRSCSSRHLQSFVVACLVFFDCSLQSNSIYMLIHVGPFSE